MNHNAMVRPRSWGCKRPCMTVDIAVVVKKYDAPSTKPVINAGIAERDAAKPNIATALAAKPQRIITRGSRPTNSVPSARPPSAAPNAHVAYSHLYIAVSPLIPKFNSATAGKSPMYGSEMSEYNANVRMSRRTTGRSRATRNANVKRCQPRVVSRV